MNQESSQISEPLSRKHAGGQCLLILAGTERLEIVVTLSHAVQMGIQVATFIRLLVEDSPPKLSATKIQQHRGESACPLDPGGSTVSNRGQYPALRHACGSSVEHTLTDTLAMFTNIFDRNATLADPVINQQVKVFRTGGFETRSFRLIVNRKSTWLLVRGWHFESQKSLGVRSSCFADARERSAVRFVAAR